MPNGTDGIPVSSSGEVLQVWGANIVRQLRHLTEAVEQHGKDLGAAKTELIEQIHQLDLKITNEIAAVRLERQQAEQACVETRISPIKLQLKGMSAVYGLIGASIPCGITLLIFFLSR